MKNMDEWKDIQDVYISQANTIGFQESVIIRDYIPPKEPSVFMPEADGTELLRPEDNETELLHPEDNETELLRPETDETELLRPEEDETDLLVEADGDATVLAMPEYSGDDETVLAFTAYESLALKRVKTQEIVLVTGDEFYIGKQAGNNYVIKDNPMISRRHVRIFKQDGSYWIEDLDSLNHTYINDSMILAPVVLTPSMTFRLSTDEGFEVI